MLASDDLYLGQFSIGSGILPIFSSSADPTVNQGLGPAGRTFFHNNVPLTAQTNNVALAQTMTASTALTLTAGTGATSGLAPDGSQRTVIIFDTPRAVSLTSITDLHLISFTIVGFDFYGRLQTQTRVGPTGNTVNTLKAFQSVLSVTPGTTDLAHNIAVGSSDIFGMPYRINDKTLLFSVLWNNSFTTDTGAFVVADGSTATAATGDTRGTYLPSSASDGVKRLCIGMHLDGTQCGKSATVANAIGVTPA